MSIDIDLVIDSDEKIKGFKLFPLISKTPELFGKNIDAFEKSEIIKDSLVDKEIRTNGIIIYNNISIITIIVDLLT